MYIHEVMAGRMQAEQNLADAKDMHENDEDLRDIHDETGWFPGRDGIFRTRVSDEDMSLTGELEEQGMTTVGEAVNHDKLFDIVEELEDTPIVHDPTLDSRGAYSPDQEVIFVQDAEDLDAIAHEMNHDLQNKSNAPEGSRGTSPEAAGSDEAYFDDLGEQEAWETGEHAGSELPDTPELLEDAEEHGVGPSIKM